MVRQIETANVKTENIHRHPSTNALVLSRRGVCKLDPQVALAEAEFAQTMGARYAVGVNSCSSAILIGLMCVGVKAGDEVRAFNLGDQ